MRSSSLAAALLPRLLVSSALRFILQFARPRLPRRWRLGRVGGLLQPHLQGARTHLHAQSMRTLGSSVVDRAPKQPLRPPLIRRAVRESLRRTSVPRRRAGRGCLGTRIAISHFNFRRS